MIFQTYNLNRQGTLPPPPPRKKDAAAAAAAWYVLCDGQALRERASHSHRQKQQGEQKGSSRKRKRTNTWISPARALHPLPITYSSSSSSISDSPLCSPCISRPLLRILPLPPPPPPQLLAVQHKTRTLWRSRLRCLYLLSQFYFAFHTSQVSLCFLSCYHYQYQYHHHHDHKPSKATREQLSTEHTVCSVQNLQSQSCYSRILLSLTHLAHLCSSLLSTLV